MTTPARVKEADDASVAFQIALTQIGAKSIEDALTLWQDVPVQMQTATAARWLDQALRLVLFRRRRSQSIALSYYRLARALRTGTTIADPAKPEPTYVSLDMLRDEFGALTTPAFLAGGEVPPGGAQQASDPQAQSTPAESSSVPQAGAQSEDEDDPDDDLILVEEIAELEAELERIEEQAMEETRDLLIQLGPMNSRKKQAAIDQTQDGKAVDAARQKAHQQAGNRQASIAAHAIQNGARSAIYGTGQKDKKVIGWLRLSRTGTPCGWCAMLISRGPVYRSAKTAGDTDKYHPNCNCYAEPVYTRAQYDDSPLYELNRRYARLWPQVTAGLGGDAALTAWRAYIRRQQASPVQATGAA